MSYLVRSIERTAVSYCNQRIVKAMPLCMVVMHVASSHYLKACSVGYIAKRSVECSITAHGVALQLYEETVSSKNVTPTLGQSQCGCVPVAEKYRG